MFQHAAGFEELTERIIGCAKEVHTVLGAGLLESIYSFCLAIEFKEAGLTFERERVVPIVYKGRRMHAPLKVDFVVEGTVLIEVKAVEAIAPVHEAQVITYLKLTGCRVGLLINFNVPSLRSGIRRLDNRALRA